MPATVPTASRKLDAEHEFPEVNQTAVADESGSPSIAILLALIVGVLFRILQYGVNRSLWVDEAALAVSIVERSFTQLLDPLALGQTAPLGFLWLQRVAVISLGPTEYALRLFPLLAGLATLALAPALLRRYAGEAAVPWGVTVFALSPFLVYYSAEAKQYAFDALLACAVLLCAHALHRRPQSDRAFAALALVATVGVWLSQPLVFVLGGTGTVLGGIWLAERRRSAVVRLAAVCGVWGSSFLGSYLHSRSTLADPSYMRDFWRSGFMPLPPTTPAEWLWLPQRLFRFFHDPVGIITDDAVHSLPIAIAGMIATAVACAWMARRGRGIELALLLSPLALLLVASALQLYPFGGGFRSGGRVVLFLLPAAYVLIAQGTALAWARARPAGALLGLMLIGPMAAYGAVGVPQLRSEMKPMLEYVREGWREGDVLYVQYYGRAQFDFYAERYGFAAENVVVGRCARFRPQEYLDDLRRLDGTARLWVLFADGSGPYGFDERRLMLDYLDTVANRLDDQVSHGSSVYLFEMSGVAERPFRAQIPSLPYDAAADCRGPWAPTP